jgi:hypothetical protein
VLIKYNLILTEDKETPHYGVQISYQTYEENIADRKLLYRRPDKMMEGIKIQPSN